MAHFHSAITIAVCDDFSIQYMATTSNKLIYRVGQKSKPQAVCISDVTNT